MIAAYQAPLLPARSMDSLDLIRARVQWCESEGISILCCPEAILGGRIRAGIPPASRYPFEAVSSALFWRRLRAT